MKKYYFSVWIAVLALGMGYFGSVLERNFHPGFTPPSSELPVQMKLVNEDSEVIKAISNVAPSVVSIVVTKDLQVMRMNPGFDDPFYFFNAVPETQRQEVGGGTGFIFSKEGLILTNRHVVSDEDAEYTAILQNGDEYPIEVQDRDPFNDIAVVKIKPTDKKPLPKDLPTVTFGDSNALKVGQRVIAVGNALGQFSNTVTVGVLSAKERSIMASDGWGRGENLTNLLQTDAAVNPGNSGGPLLNLTGEVIGINTAIAAGASGLSFAIPINDVKVVIDSIQKTGKISRPMLGVRYIQLDEKTAEEFKVTGTKEGALLIGNSLNKEFAVLPGAPAEKAGLKEGDVIVEIDGENITKDNPLHRVIAKHMAGEKLKVRYLRENKELQTTITLEEYKADEAKS